MKFKALLIGLGLAALQNVTWASSTHSFAPLNDGLMGWATKAPSGLPTGGQGQNSVSCTASTQETLLACVERMHQPTNLKSPFTLFVEGTIDGATEADGSGYTKIIIKRSNLSIIGVAYGEMLPTLRANWIMAMGKENLVIRNLRIIPGRDHQLKEVEEGCHSKDTDYCDWNAEPDALTIQSTQGVWIDHCEFSDGPNYNGVNPNKSHYKGFDGLLDIKRGANYVTISYSKFSNHDKSILIGHSDKHSTDNFHVTFYRNYFHHLGQRSPRVRYGKVHLLNNVYENVKKTEYNQKYFLTYAIGMAFKSQVYSENNVFDVPGATAKNLLDVSEFSNWAQHFTDTGSWLNGHKVDLNKAAKENINTREAKLKKGLSFIGPVTWAPKDAYNYKALDNPASIRKLVKANAGVGIIEVNN